MENILSRECLDNILGHIKNCWNYDYPTGKTLESAIFRGLQPFYSDAESLGSPSTIVDTGKGTHAFDIKGNKQLGHVKKVGKSANYEKNIFVEQRVPNEGLIRVRIPQSVVTQVRRPKVDLKGYKGNAEKILAEQVKDYHEFAIKTTKKDGYNELFSIVVLYGIEKGFKSIFLTISKFDIPKMVKHNIGTKQDGTPCSYQGFNEKGDVVFSLSSFNKGSSNFYKRFYTQHGELMTWPATSADQTIFTRSELEKTCAMKTIK